MKHSATINANESVLLCTASRMADNRMFEGTILAYGTFDSGTVTIQASPDGGITKITLKDEFGDPVQITANDAYNIKTGFPGKNTDRLEIYATMGDAVSAPDVQVDIFTNE